MTETVADVSRETAERLNIFADLVRKWTPKINLIAPSTVAELETRHIGDSHQLLDLAGNARTWIDLGSGGGFPGAVVAIAGQDRGLDVTLVESDARKAAFLRTVARETGVPMSILNRRIEDVTGAFDIVSARALAPLSRLLELAHPLVTRDGRCLFLKGAKAQDEVAEALENWTFDCKTHPSKTAPDAVVLDIGGIERV